MQKKFKSHYGTSGTSSMKIKNSVLDDYFVLDFRDPSSPNLYKICSDNLIYNTGSD